MPPLVTYCIRWFPVPESAPSYLYRFSKFTYGDPANIDASIGFFEVPRYAIYFYVIWQIGYHYFIMIRRADNVYGGSHATSFTWLLSDYSKKRASDPLTKIFLNTPEQYRVYLFEFVNFLYAFVCILPTGFIYHSFLLHTALIIFLVTIAIFNGANFYMEIFSRKYAQELARLEAINNSGQDPLESDNIQPTDEQKKEQ
jgi:hypothetical protein